ncbi:MAG: DUF5615 family PIN-like protein [Alphaproteobacteria bacterium]|nr:DUF5615 family PIN-like protein [Alphaproteobacteria bacterium]
MKILADVNVSRSVVERLRAAGHETMRVTEVMDPRASDAAIIAEARKRSAVVLSHDQDHGALLAISGAVGPSLVNLRVSQVDAGHLAARLVSVLQSLKAELEAGAVVTVEDHRVRIHRLPIA